MKTKYAIGGILNGEMVYWNSHSQCLSSEFIPEHLYEYKTLELIKKLSEKFKFKASLWIEEPPVESKSTWGVVNPKSTALKRYNSRISEINKEIKKLNKELLLIVSKKDKLISGSVPKYACSRCAEQAVSYCNGRHCDAHPDGMWFCEKCREIDYCYTDM